MQKKQITIFKSIWNIVKESQGDCCYETWVGGQVKFRLLPTPYAILKNSSWLVFSKSRFISDFILYLFMFSFFLKISAYVFTQRSLKMCFPFVSHNPFVACPDSTGMYAHDIYLYITFALVTEKKCFKTADNKMQIKCIIIEMLFFLRIICKFLVLN